MCRENANHASLLPRFVDELLQESQGLSVDAIALSEGPGSYTGLRIGTSLAKGLAYGWNVPIVAVPTLSVLVAAAVQQASIAHDARLVPMLDARRMEVYTAVYDAEQHPLTDVEAKIIQADSFADWLGQSPVCFFGDGAAKCQTVIQHPNACFLCDILPDARWMQPIAQSLLDEGKTVDIAYFEPFYLKEFVAAPSHVKGLNG